MISLKKNKNNFTVKNRFFVYNVIKKYFLIPIKEGLYGFLAVIAVVIVAKILSFLFGVNSHFNLDQSDMMLSFMGFFFRSLIYLLNIFNPKKEIIERTM